MDAHVTTRKRSSHFSGSWVTEYVTRSPEKRQSERLAATVPFVDHGGAIARIEQEDPVDEIVSSTELARPARSDQVVLRVGAPVRMGNDMVEGGAATQHDSMPTRVCPALWQEVWVQLADSPESHRVEDSCLAPAAPPAIACVDAALDLLGWHPRRWTFFHRPGDELAFRGAVASCPLDHGLVEVPSKQGIVELGQQLSCARVVLCSTRRLTKRRHGNVGVRETGQKRGRRQFHLSNLGPHEMHAAHVRIAAPSSRLAVSKLVSSDSDGIHRPLSGLVPPR